MPFEKIMCLNKSRVLLLACLLFFSACLGPSPSGSYELPIDTAIQPVQSYEDCPRELIQKSGSLDYKMTLLAKYKVSAQVVSRYNYWYDDWRAKVAPYDLALAWGDLIKPQNDKHIRYSQSGRWYYYHWDKDASFGEDFIIRHSSNNHIIPANRNILAAIRVLPKRRPVILEGYLVNIDGKENGRDFYWHTSLSRDDTGNGSCELFYITKLTFGGKVYQ